MSSRAKTHCEPGSRERILKTAVKKFARQGYGNTGLRELAKEAEVNLAMINYFFGSKKALLKEILDIFFSGYLKVARRELSGKENSTAVKLEKFIHGAIAYFASHRDYLLVAIGELHHDDPEIIEHKAGWGRHMMKTVKEFLDSTGSDCETGPAMAPVIFTSTLTSMMASRFLFTPVMEQVQPDVLGTISLEEYTDTVTRIFLQGVGKIICLKENAQTK